MSKVAITGNASGTGTFTIASPNSNTDRTLTLPDNSGTVFTNAGGTMTGALALPAGGLNVGSGQLAVGASGYVTMSAMPAFHAYGLGSTPSMSNVIYPTAEFNTGGHYNTANGRFTAPVTGKYMFGWTSIGNTTADIYRWFFRINGVTIGDLHYRQDTTATGGEYATNGMFVILWPLTQGDYVSIYYRSDAGTAPYGNNESVNEYPRFWGYLVG